MKTPFFITGLPRSRTAWLANFFTTDQTLCYHDVTALGKPPAELIIQGPTGMRIGISDPILTVQFEELMHRYPNAPWLYVNRPAEQCLESLIRFMAAAGQPLSRVQAEQLFRFHHERAQWLLQRPHVHTIQFDQLDVYGALACAWYHLIPDIEFNFDRWRVLNQFRVEQIPEKVLKGAK